MRDYVRGALGDILLGRLGRRIEKAEPQFVYRDQHGAPYLRVTKVHKDGGKELLSALMDGQEWVKGGQQVRIPYRLPEVISASEVFIGRGREGR